MKALTALLGAATSSVAAMISAGAGFAAADPDVVGQTYRDAKSTIQRAARYRQMRRHERVEQAECHPAQAGAGPGRGLGRAELQCRGRGPGIAWKLCREP